MTKYFISGFTVFTLFFINPSFADDISKNKNDTDKLRCFTIYCLYHKKADDRFGHSKCRAISTFKKWVGKGGQELEDDSSPPMNPSLDIECDGKVIYGDSSVRFTNRMGTRIQAAPGPFPALLLPRDSLHDGHFYNFSFLQLESQTLSGQCFISVTSQHDPSR